MSEPGERAVFKPEQWAVFTDLLLDFQAFPGRYALAMREPRPLFDHATVILTLAAGRTVAGLPEDAERLGRLHAAARFFVRVAMLRPGADHYTLLGLAPGFDAATLREHYRILIRLTHPDFAAGGGSWPADAATRINQANDVLTSPERRRDYKPTTPKQPQWFPPAALPAMNESWEGVSTKRIWPAVVGGVGLAAIVAALFWPSESPQERLAALMQVPVSVSVPEPALPAPSPAKPVAVAPAPASPSPSPSPSALAVAVAVAPEAMPAPPPPTAAVAHLDKAVVSRPALLASPARASVEVLAAAPAPVPPAPRVAVAVPEPVPVPVAVRSPAPAQSGAPRTMVAPAPASALALAAVAAPVSSPVAVPRMVDVQPLLSQLLGALQSGRGDQVIRLVDRSARQGDGGARFAEVYNRTVSGSRTVKLGAVQFGAKNGGDQLVVDGVVVLNLQDEGAQGTTRELVLRALFALRGGQPVLTQLSADEATR